MSGSPQQDDEALASPPGQQSGTVNSGTCSREVESVFWVRQEFKSLLDRTLIRNWPTA